MSLASPPIGLQRVESSLTAASTTDVGDTVTASGSTNTKGSWAELIASTARDAFGIYVQLSGVAESGFARAMLVDIGIGTTVLLPDLNAGGASPSDGTARATGAHYYFPVYVPAGSQIQARCAASLASDTVVAVVWLFSDPSPGLWYGNRVTAYGVDAANSRGVILSNTGASTTAYGNWTEITSSTTNPIRYMQIGVGLGGNGAQTTTERQHRVGVGAASSEVELISQLRWRIGGTEDLHGLVANLHLAAHGWNLAAGSRLAGSYLGAVEDADLIVYGVD